MGRSVVSTEATATGTRRETGSCRPKWSPIPTTADTWIPVSEPRGKLSSGHLSGVGFGWYLARISLHIIGKNIANKVRTSYFHSVIRTKKGNKRKHSKFFYIDNWGGLSDGVHGTYDTRLKWAKCLSNSIDLNRGTNSKLKHSIDNMETNNKRKHSTDNISSDDEPHSPKRSWRRDRTN